MQKTRVQDLVIGLAVIALGVFFWTYTPDFSDVSKRFCRFVLLLFLALGLILCVVSVLNAKKPAGKEVTVKEFKNPMIMFIFLVVYVVLMNVLGFFTASVLFMPGVMIYMGYRKPVTMICVTAGMLGFVYVLFVAWLKVRLPSGILF